MFVCLFDKYNTKRLHLFDNFFEMIFYFRTKMLLKPLLLLMFLGEKSGFTTRCNRAAANGSVLRTLI
jgi:hypothetical protein